ncbi:low-density lipoprotein receptor-related protein 6-like [Anneissia japonica]|uniref:low-density lipoprotein receptor-related protein 6-like n=1 Tax=Anneissia japonica TaxID=1529436 RepID=UPI0014256413|nr:low-density lipoprotein receptor-related protein 6-like [Anneissia japonica]
MGAMRFMTTLINFCSIILAVRAEPYLVYANRRDIRLIDAGSDKPKTSHAVVINGLDDAAAVDFIYEEQYFFWTDINLARISKTFFNGTRGNEEEDIITSGLISNDGLACDWIGRKIYWTDSETKRIEVANLDGSSRKVLFWEDLDQPRAIALDPVNGYMYWTDWGELPKIERAGMDGTQRSVVIDENIYWPNGLTIDYEESRLFWADAKRTFIHSCNFDGSNRTSVVEGADLLPHPFALTLYRDTLYWTDWELHRISSCNKYNGSNRKVVKNDVFSPMDIHVYSAARQRKSNTNPCSKNNGGCSHLCLMAPNELHYSCACPTGVLLLEDQHTCADGPREILLLAKRRDIRRISLDTPDYTDVVIQLKDVKNAIAIDYDPIEGFMYWTDDEEHAIRRSKLDGTESEYIIQRDISSPDGIAVDWISRNLYWTDTGSNRIEVSRLNGTSRLVLIDDDLDEPRAIAVDPEDGYMYWTDWGENPKIERAALDGSHRKILINTSLNWPNGIAVDYEQRKIYWGDAQTDRIERADLDGRNRVILVDSSETPHIFGFSLLGDYVYWTDWQRRCIERVNKYTGKDRELIIDALPDLMGLKAIDLTKKSGTNPCNEENAGCSNLCFYKHAAVVCMCPTGLELHADKKTCIVPEAFLVFLRQNIGLRRIALETNNSDVAIPVVGAREGSALDFDFVGDRIYWFNRKTKEIMTAFMNGSGYEIVIEYGLEFPEDIAVDWTGKNLYWTDTGTDRIEVSRLDGSSRRVLIWEDVEAPTSLALDPVAGYMYWSEWSTPYRIARAHMDGTNRKVLMLVEGRANGLTIDYQARRLFWVDLDLSEIYSSNLDGSNKIQVVQDGITNPLGLTQYNEFIYWADLSAMTIERANKTSGAGREIIQGQQDHVLDIKVFHKSRQAGINKCNSHNGGCSDLCLAHPDGFRCKCEAHHTLNSDNTTCSAPEAFLIYSQRDTLNRMLFNFEEPDIVLPISETQTVKAVEYDFEAEIIFWIDKKNKKIMHAKSNGISPKPLVSGNDISPYDMAFEPYSKLIFWTCDSFNQINVVQANGTVMGAIVQKPHQKPRSIALLPLKGLMFWTNMQEGKPTLEQGSLDGYTNHLELISTGLYEPGPITADADSNRVYWFDHRLQAIEYVDITSGTRSRPVSDNIVKVVGLTVYGDFIYWVDKHMKCIKRANKNSGDNQQTMLGRMDLLTDILAVKKPTDASQPCSFRNGHCSHFCIPTGVGTARCSCPSHLNLHEDEVQCIEPPTCAPDYFACLSGNGECIPKTWLCDTEPDFFFVVGSCADDEFVCDDGSCVPEGNRCDGAPQCDDGSDEEACSEPCFHWQFVCKNKQCVDVENPLCDNITQCKDKSDEFNCTVSVRQSQTNDFKEKALVAAIIFSIVLAVIIITLVICCRRLNPSEALDNERYNSASQHNLSTVLVLNQLHKEQTTRKYLNSTVMMHPKTTNLTNSLKGNSSAGTGVNERPRPTGTSSCSSNSVSGYPKETLNPPPSPVTERSHFPVVYFNQPSPKLPLKSCYKHYKVRNIPPPPTPCSSDICNDSEPTTNLHKKRRKGGRYYKCVEVKYDLADPYPPPPTPQSCLSDNQESCPPSPSTERSYFNPYPPPPSPATDST